ncbi:hypothetical protein [uncultured Thomasclavelia sp.]|uniref:hypothetical protein n=1 Tax=uncultured Thomasclavelia sp. TaxID=3025759 RepID=UPI0025ED3615|nr:hypothetical protein [uncultured Thomasclavelia sp.]
MECSNCGHEFKPSSFAYKARQKCPECGTIMQIQFPPGIGFVPIIIALIVGLYVVMVAGFDLIVGISVFVLVYWPVEIIMDLILIYMGQYRLYELEK